MSRRDLVWSSKAAKQYLELLKRRNDTKQVRSCVEAHLTALADDIDLARKFQGPGNLRIYRFRCQDGSTDLYLQAEIETLSDTQLAILGCGTIQF
jgi:hypothetical protein